MLGKEVGVMVVLLLLLLLVIRMLCHLKLIPET